MGKVLGSNDVAHKPVLDDRVFRSISPLARQIFISIVYRISGPDLSLDSLWSKIIIVV
jgi:hypothetical protein